MCSISFIVRSENRFVKEKPSYFQRAGISHNLAEIVKSGHDMFTIGDHQECEQFRSAEDGKKLIGIDILDVVLISEYIHI